MATAPEAPRFEAEPVLRFAFAGLGTIEDAHRSNLNVLLGHLFGGIDQTVLEWRDLADAEIVRWDDVDEPGADARTAELLADLLDRDRALQAQIEAGAPA